MKRTTATIFRVTGIIFFVVSFMWVVQVLDTGISAFEFIINGEDRALTVYQFIISLIYTTAFLFAIFATGTAALFGGKNGFTQSVWNCAVYALVLLSIYTSCRIMGGVQVEEQFRLSQSIIMQLFFCIIIFVCLREEDEFSFKNILPQDQNTKLCLKVYGIMLLLFELTFFLMSHIS